MCRGNSSCSICLTVFRVWEDNCFLTNTDRLNTPRPVLLPSAPWLFYFKQHGFYYLMAEGGPGCCWAQLLEGGKEQTVTGLSYKGVSQNPRGHQGHYHCWLRSWAISSPDSSWSKSQPGEAEIEENNTQLALFDSTKYPYLHNVIHFSFPTKPRRNLRS